MTEEEALNEISRIIEQADYHEIDDRSAMKLLLDIAIEQPIGRVTSRALNGCSYNILNHKRHRRPRMEPPASINIPEDFQYYSTNAVLLRDLAIEIPELKQEILAINNALLEKCLTLDIEQFDVHLIKKLLSTMSCTIKTNNENKIELKPELADNILSLVEQALSSDENNCDSLGNAYDTLGEIVTAKPELADKILPLVEQALSSDENNWYSLEKACDTLGEIARAKPELAEQAGNLIFRI